MVTADQWVNDLKSTTESAPSRIHVDNVGYDNREYYDRQQFKQELLKLIDEIDNPDTIIYGGFTIGDLQTNQLSLVNFFNYVQNPPHFTGQVNQVITQFKSTEDLHRFNAEYKHHSSVGIEHSPTATDNHLFISHNEYLSSIITLTTKRVEDE